MAETSDVRLTGGCQCGAVRYVLTAAPTGASLCHCRMCQKAGGAPFMTFGGVALSQIAWTGRPKVFASSSAAERGFCGACGTPLTYRVHGRDRISVTLGSLDDPEAVCPVHQDGVESRLTWTRAVLDLPETRTPAQAGSFRSNQHSR